MIRALWQQHRRLFIALPLAGFVLGAAASLLRSERWQSESRFMPQHSREDASGVAGLAAQFGVSIGRVAASGEPLELYAELVRSREILKQAVESRYSSGEQRGQQSLMDIYNASGDTDAERIRAAIQRLEQNIVVQPNIRSGLVTVRTTANTPQLAAELNRRLLTLVAQFNRQTRQSQAGAERQFLEARLTQADSALRGAEAQLTRFYDQNRGGYENSPQLKNQAATLERAVDFRQQIYTSLAENYEEARISEVRNTPVITIIDPPEIWVRRSTRGPLSSGVLGGMFGLALAFAIYYGVKRGVFAELFGAAPSKDHTYGPAELQPIQGVVSARQTR